MRTPAVLLIAGCVWLSGDVLSGQEQAKPAPSAQKPAPARPTVTVVVTDMEGKPLPDVQVRASGPVDREAASDADGTVTFRNMTAGSYRLRFEHGEYVTLEREVAVQAGRPLKVSASLSALPVAAAPPPRPEPETARPATDLPPAGPPTSLSIPDFVEKNFVGNAPSLVSPIGCAPAATARLLQLRDPLTQHAHDDADELLYVVAGEGTHKVGGRDIPLSAGVFSVVPRGTPHSIVRRGSRPIIVVSIAAGPPCQQ